MRTRPIHANGWTRAEAIAHLLFACTLTIALVVSPTSAMAEYSLIWGVPGNERSGLGGSALSVGDLDTDGYEDFALGGLDTASQPGQVAIVSGRSGLSITVLTGLEDGDKFGAAISTPGDLDNDGVPDLVIGAPGVTVGGVAYSGSVTAYSMSTRTQIFRIDGGQGDTISGDRLGETLAQIADVDLDSVPDFAAGAPSAMNSLGRHSGVVRLFSGRTGALITTIEGDSTGERFGACLVLLGDLSGNGHRDLLVGAPGAVVGGLGGSGAVRVFDPFTGQLIHSLLGSATECGFGTAGASVGDMNHDGVDDFAVSAPCQTLIAGTVRFYSGADATLLDEISGPIGSGFGASLGSGDFDGDGQQDMAVGAPLLGIIPTIYHGGVFIYSGMSGPYSFLVEGLSDYENLGASVSHVADITGDGTKEVIIGAPGAFAGSGIGYVYGKSDVASAQAFLPGGATSNVSTLPDPVIVRLEPDGGFTLAMVRPETITLRASGDVFREIRPVNVDLLAAGDSNGNGIPEAAVAFRREDWRDFMGPLAEGANSISSILEGGLSGGGRFRGTLTMNAVVPSSLSTCIYPNPVRDGATIAFRKSGQGYLDVSIFDVHGRHVRTLYQQGTASDGYYNIAFDKERLASGVYFLKVSAADGTNTTRFVITK